MLSWFVAYEQQAIPYSLGMNLDLCETALWYLCDNEIAHTHSLEHFPFVKTHVTVLSDQNHEILLYLV